MLRPSGANLESRLAHFDYQRIEYLDGGRKTEAFFVRPPTRTIASTRRSRSDREGQLHDRF